MTLVEIAGSKVICGGNNLASGELNDDSQAKALNRVKQRGFANEEAKCALARIAGNTPTGLARFRTVGAVARRHCRPDQRSRAHCRVLIVKS